MKLKCKSCKIWLPLLAILGAGFYIAWQFVPPAASNNLRIAAGSEGSTYYHYAQAYQQSLKSEGINLELQTTAGSVESLKLLREGKVDLAFIQGGIGKNVPAEEGLHSIASLFYEPLWVFMRKDTGNQSTSYLHELQGKRLAIGEEGSGTHALASRLLYDSGVKSDNTTLFSVSGKNAISKLEAGVIDAAFFVSAPESDTVTQLTNHVDIQIMNFKRHADAYTRRYPFLDALHLGEGSLNLQTNVPHNDMTLLAATAALVVSKNMHADHIRLLTREALRIHSKAGLLEKPWQFPSKQHLEIPIHPDAEQYLQNGPSFLETYLPFSVAARLDQLKIMLIPLLTLLLPLAKGVVPLYQRRIRSRTYRWYKDLNQVDRELGNYDLHKTQQAIGNMKQLHGELAREVSVPLSYMSEFYAMRVHTDHILRRLQERETSLLGDTDNKAVETFPANEPPDDIAMPTSVANEAVEVDVDVDVDVVAPESIKSMASKLHIPHSFSLSTLKLSRNQAQPADASTPHYADTKDKTATSAIKNIAAKIHLPRHFDLSTLRPSATKQEEAEKIAKAEAAAAVRAQEEARLASIAAIAARHKQANHLVGKHIAAGMALSAVPIPILDVAALTSTQLNLIHSLSEHYGVDFDRKHGKFILLSMISSSLPTTAMMGLSSLSKSIPVIGTLGGGASLTALSGAIIFATGKVFIRHFDAGGKLEDFDSKQQQDDFRKALKEGLKKDEEALAGQSA